MRKLYFLFVTLLVSTVFHLDILQGQGVISMDKAKTTSVDKIPQSQIEKVVRQMEEQGVSTEEAVAIARAKGASDAQIDQLLRRIKSVKNKATVAPVKEAAVLKKNIAFSKKEQAAEEAATVQTFGFDFFNTKNLNFASNLNTPLSNDYIIGVGDNIQINVYGASQQDYSLQVRTNRAIQIPNIGPVYIGGVALGKAKKLIKSRLASIYNGMQGSSPNTFVSINVGDVAGININVIGEVNKPGTYTLPATATVFNALYLAGGPGTNGSFRAIDVVRNGKTISTIDVYDYLIKGDTRGNIQLRNNDVVLVKPYLQRIFVEGAFKRQGIFEAKPGETLADIIRYAGGFTADAYQKQVSLTRNNSQTLDFITVNATNFESTPLLNGDQIEAGKVIELYENRVNISGSVYRPGNYELTKGLTLKELIEKAEGLKEDAFLERGIITRKLDNLELKTLSFSVKDVLNGSEDIPLKREDKVLISSIFDMRENRTIEIMGAVQKPGTFPYAENLTLADVIFMAGGFKEDAAISNIEIARRLSHEEAQDYSNTLVHTYTVSVNRGLQLNATDAKMLLKPFDYIYVRNAPGYDKGQGTVSIKGEVKYTGDYGIKHKQERISDFIERAGGFTPEAYIEGISLRRKTVLTEAQYEARLWAASQDSTMNVNDVKKVEYEIVAVNIQDMLRDKGGNADLILQDGDQLYIPSKMQTVSIKGAVLNPVIVTYKKNLNARDYINLSGGFTNNAKRGRVYVVYPNGEAHATKSFIFRRWPKVVPGSEIIVPEKPEIDRAGQVQRWIGLGSGIAGIAASVAALVSLTK